MRRIKSWLSISVLVLLSLCLLGCGGDNPPPPTAPPAGGSTGVMSGYLEEPCPGTPLTQLSNYNDSLNVMMQNLSGSGFATVQSQSSISYSVQWNGSTMAWVRSNEQQNPSQVPTYRYQGQFGSWGGNIGLSQMGSSQQFQFSSEISLPGLILKSTDACALFEGTSGSDRTIVKIPYRTANPAIYLFRIRTMPTWGPMMGGMSPYPTGYTGYPQQDYYGGNYGQSQNYLVFRQQMTSAIQTIMQYGGYPGSVSGYTGQGGNYGGTGGGWGPGYEYGYY